MVLWALENAQGGEIFVPKIPSYRIMDLAEAIGPECEKRIVGIRPGEKIHEEMITAGDSFNAVDFGPYFAILPTEREVEASVERVSPGKSYGSGTNSEFLSIKRIRELITQHVDSSFDV
jgi:FlaA1/EpsC-like NDP-sugar epimerase